MVDIDICSLNEKNDTCSLSMHLNVVHTCDAKNHLHKIDPKHSSPKARVPILNFTSFCYKGYSDIRD